MPLTPAQRAFGIGLSPLTKVFLPPEGMENDPAYNDYGRNQIKQARSQLNEEELNRGKQNLEKAKVREAFQLGSAAFQDRQKQAQLGKIEDDAIAFAKAHPEQNADLLTKFPELVRSKHVGEFGRLAETARAPTKAQETLANHIRQTLSPEEIPHFQEGMERYGNDVLKAREHAAQRAGSQKAEAELVQKYGVPLAMIEEDKKRFGAEHLNPVQLADIQNRHEKALGITQQDRTIFNDWSREMRLDPRSAEQFRQNMVAAGVDPWSKMSGNAPQTVQPVAPQVQVQGPPSPASVPGSFGGTLRTGIPVAPQAQTTQVGAPPISRLGRNAPEAIEAAQRTALAKEHNELYKSRLAELKDAIKIDSESGSSDPEYSKALNDEYKQTLMEHGAMLGALRKPKETPSASTRVSDVAKKVAQKAVESAAPENRASPEASSAVPIEQQIDLSKVPFHEVEKRIAEKTKEAKEDVEINKAWNDAQLDLQSKLEKQIGTGNYPGTNYSKLRRFAEAVKAGELSNESAVSPELKGTEADIPLSVSEAMLRNLRLQGKAFHEPGNRRTGTQAVPYNQLLEVWANNFLNQAPVTTHPQIPAIPAELNAIKNELLKKYVPASK